MENDTQKRNIDTERNVTQRKCNFFLFIALKIMYIFTRFYQTKHCNERRMREWKRERTQNVAGKKHLSLFAAVPVCSFFFTALFHTHTRSFCRQIFARFSLLFFFFSSFFWFSLFLSITLSLALALSLVHFALSRCFDIKTA